MAALTSFRRALYAATPALALGTAVLTAALAACSDSTTGPTPAPAVARAISSGPSHATSPTTSGSTLVTATALTRLIPLASPITRSVTLHATGGVLQIPEAGLMVTIPSGAVGDTTVTITATALAGHAVAYDFQPHGAQFLTHLKVNQSLAGTTWVGNTGMIQVGAGYFANTDQVNTTTGAAQLDEVLAGTISGNSFRFDVAHFSGYLVSTGRH